MAFHHERNCKTVSSSTITPSFPFPFPVVCPPPPPSKHAPTAKADTVCSPGKSADSQHKSKPILLRGHRSIAQGATRCQVNRRQAISFHNSFVPELTWPKTQIFALEKHNRKLILRTLDMVRWFSNSCRHCVRRHSWRPFHYHIRLNIRCNLFDPTPGKLRCYRRQ